MTSHREGEATHLWQRQEISENMTDKSLRRQSSPASPSTAMVEKPVRQRRRPMSGICTDAAEGYQPLRRSSRHTATCSHNIGPFEGRNAYQPDHDSLYGDIALTSPLIPDSPGAERYSKVATDEAGHTNQAQPSFRTTSWTRRLSREFSSSTNLAVKLKLVCDMPGAVTKDAGQILSSSCFTCAKAVADYWKPTKDTAERRRVDSINSSADTAERRRVDSINSSSVASPLHARSFSTGSGWSRSSRSSRSSRGSTYMEGLQQMDMTKADRKRDSTGQAKDVVTIYGVTEWGSPVVAHVR